MLYIRCRLKSESFQDLRCADDPQKVEITLNEAVLVRTVFLFYVSLILLGSSC